MRSTDTSNNSNWCDYMMMWVDATQIPVVFKLGKYKVALLLVSYKNITIIHVGEERRGDFYSRHTRYILFISVF
jgi:hypothetical protein